MARVLTNMLVILMVREGGLRSMLAARLALSGVDVVSMDQVEAGRILRLGGQAPVLVADDGALQCHPGGLEALVGDPIWHRLIILGDGPKAAMPSHVHHIGVDECVPAIAAMLRDGGTAMR